MYSIPSLGSCGWAFARPLGIWMAINLDVSRPFPEGVQKDIRLAIKHSAKLAEILQDISGRKPDTSPATFFGEISERLGVDFQDVSRTFTAIENLASISQELSGPEDVIGLLEKRLSPPGVAELQAARDEVTRLLEIYSHSHPVAVSIKAEKLSYLHERLYQDGEIITDARPVFDADGRNLLELVITHALVVNSYSFRSNIERMHFAMDGADVLKLRKACDRAIAKASGLKTALRNGPWITRVLNERDDDG